MRTLIRNAVAVALLSAGASAVAADVEVRTIAKTFDLEVAHNRMEYQTGKENIEGEAPPPGEIPLVDVAEVARNPPHPEHPENLHDREEYGLCHREQTRARWRARRQERMRSSDAAKPLPRRDAANV